MVAANNRPTGLTKDAGYQIGARRTLPIRLEVAWRLVISPEGLFSWLGGAPRLNWTKGERYQLPDGTYGEIRVFTPNCHLRFTWHPPGWPRSSTIQVRVLPKGDRTVIAFHQEHLPGPEEREERRAHFLTALDELERIIRSGDDVG